MRWPSSGNQWTFTNDEILFKSAERRLWTYVHSTRCCSAQWPEFLSTERGKALLNPFQAMVSRSMLYPRSKPGPSGRVLFRNSACRSPKTVTAFILSRDRRRNVPDSACRSEGGGCMREISTDGGWTGEIVDIF